MSESSITSIAQLCGTLKNLTSLKLNLTNWYKCGSDKAFDEMKKSISQLTLLTQLDLDLHGVGSGYNNNMTESSIISIAQLCDTLKNLTSLKLDLYNWNKCGSDKAFDEMKKSISQLTLLTQLDLNLLGVGYYNNNMTESSITSIAQLCGTLKNLTSLKLDLTYWNKCGSDEAFDDMKK
jgi:hypothetical protein